MIIVTEYRYERSYDPELRRYLPLWDYTGEKKHVSEMREQMLALVYGWA